jgi:hypothetical protein
VNKDVCFVQEIWSIGCRNNKLAVLNVGQASDNHKYLQGTTDITERQLQGTCGNGSRGNGVCFDGSTCCSPFGWCGTSPEHCSTTTTTTPPPTSPAPTPPPPQASGTCGNGSRGNGVCFDGSTCCSPFGWCGTSPEHCSTTTTTTPPPTSPAPTPPPPQASGTCGNGSRGNGVCSDDTCVHHLAGVVHRPSTAQQPLLLPLHRLLLLRLLLLLKPVEHAETGHVEMASAPMTLAVPHLAGVVPRPSTAQRLTLPLHQHQRLVRR